MEDKVTEIDKDGNETALTVSQKIKCIDSARFMTTSVSGLADNLTAEIRKIKCKDCVCFLE